MWYETRVSKLLSIQYPIILGPFGGGLSNVNLTAAISNAGGLGSFGANPFSPADIKATIAKIRELTDKPFAINLWIPLPGEETQPFSHAEFDANLKLLQPYLDKFDLPAPTYPERFSEKYEDQLDAVLEAAPPVFSFVFGIPSAEAVKELKKRGIKTIGCATTVEEAVATEAAGIDLIVASGSDAGGHRPSFLRSQEESLTGTFSLIPQIASTVHIPVIAAGGVADGRGVVAALALGAEAVQVGTRFLACDESGASEGHKAQLVSESARYTALTRSFTGRYARGIRNGFIEEMKSVEALVPPYPIQNWFTQPIRRAAMRAGQSDYMSLWAGQAAALSKRQSAAESFANLVTETEQVLSSLSR